MSSLPPRNETASFFPIESVMQSNANLDFVRPYSSALRPNCVTRSPETLLPPGRSLDPSKLAIIFLEVGPGAEIRKKLLAIKCAPEELHVDGRELYIYFPNGMARPRLSMPTVERILNKACTGRNWNTVQKLLEMADAMESAKLEHLRAATLSRQHSARPTPLSSPVWVQYPSYRSRPDSSPLEYRAQQ